MLNLQAGVHLHEIELIAFQQKLYGPSAHVTRRTRQRHRTRAHALAQVGIDGRAGRFLDDFLVAPLHRAVALAQVNHVAVRICKHLHLDVARVQQRALDQQIAVAETGQRF